MAYVGADRFLKLTNNSPPPPPPAAVWCYEMIIISNIYAHTQNKTNKNAQCRFASDKHSCFA